MPIYKLADDLSDTDLVVGDRVTNLRFGDGEVINIDSTTYSVTMVVVRLDSGDEIARSADEWEKVN